MARKTVAELLAAAKKKRDRIQKKAIKTVEDVIPPILGPGRRVAPAVTTGLTELQNLVMDHVVDQAFADFEGLEIGGPTITRPPISAAPAVAKKVRVRSDKQMVNDQIQSIALKEINKRARKKDGSFKKGWDQTRVMRLAQKECTKERERLGLCKRKSTRKGQVRKTARRAYKK